MKNADKTAYPIYESFEEGRNGYYFFDKSDGMTKRERLAMAAMQGMLSNSRESNIHTTSSLVESAVNVADALLKELEETQ